MIQLRKTTTEPCYVLPALGSPPPPPPPPPSSFFFVLSAWLYMPLRLNIKRSKIRFPSSHVEVSIKLVIPNCFCPCSSDWCMVKCAPRALSFPGGDIPEKVNGRLNSRICQPLRPWHSVPLLSIYLQYSFDANELPVCISNPVALFT